MLRMLSTPSSTSTSPGTASGEPRSLRPLAVFAVIALGVGWPLLTLSAFVGPDGPFLIATVLLGLVLPALALTQREAGWAATRALIRECVRPPIRWWWLILAGFGLPVSTWAVGAGLGGAQPLTWGLVGFYAADLVIGAVVINIWEELAWTGFFQRRAAARWGMVGGSLVTSVFFAGIHLPLALAGAHGAGEIAVNVLILACVAIGLRLLIARVDGWSGRSLLVVGLLHSSFNASETLLEPAFFWVRLVVTIALGIAVVAAGRRPRDDALER